MARPIKVGIDYFGLDVSPDEKVEYIESTYEAEGYYLWIKLLQRIYGAGFYIEWNKYQAAAMKKATGIGVERLKEILDACLEVGLFSQELFDKYSIITSRGIQKRFCTAAAKRTQVEIIPEYVLHDELWKWFHGNNPEETPVNDGNNQADDGVNSEETTDEEETPKSFSGNNPEETPLEDQLSQDNGNQSAEECGKNPEESTQSKVKQSKVKQSKAKREKSRAPKIPKIAYAENVLMTEGECKKLIDKHGQVATDWMIDALDNYKGAHGKKYTSDYRAILSWVVGKYKEHAAKSKKSAERSESNDRNGSDYAGRDWSNY